MTAVKVLYARIVLLRWFIIVPVKQCAAITAGIPPRSRTNVLTVIVAESDFWYWHPESRSRNCRTAGNQDFADGSGFDCQKFAHEDILKSFSSGEYNVLLGTQMVAKGHDIPNVTLVGILSADSTLNLPDFRASERTFALLTQAAGRAGRGDRAGHVVLQTYDPDNPVIKLAATQDYDALPPANWKSGRSWDIRLIPKF